MVVKISRLFFFTTGKFREKSDEIWSEFLTNGRWEFPVVLGKVLVHCSRSRRIFFRVKCGEQTAVHTPQLRCDEIQMPSSFQLTKKGGLMNVLYKEETVWSLVQVSCWPCWKHGGLSLRSTQPTAVLRPTLEPSRLVTKTSWYATFSSTVNDGFLFYLFVVVIISYRFASKWVLLPWPCATLSPWRFTLRIALPTRAVAQSPCRASPAAWRYIYNLIINVWGRS